LHHDYDDQGGQSGQEFNPEYLKKVEAIRNVESLLPIELTGE